MICFLEIEWQCRIGEQCIYSLWKCDNDEDCLDGFDEVDCKQILLFVILRNSLDYSDYFCYDF